MSGITRSDLYSRSLKVVNKPGNILEMDLLGNLRLDTNSLSDVKGDLTFKAKENQNIST